MSSVPVLTRDYRLTAIKAAPEIPRGLDAALYKLVGKWRARRSLARRILERSEAIAKLGLRWRDLDADAFRRELQAMRGRFLRGAKDAATVEQGLALAAEAAFRSMGMRPYPVQLAGALAMHQGYVAEMATGEGKTLTASLCAVLRGWTGHPCHVITANDYLAARDARHLRPMYALCGLSAASVGGEMQEPERRQGYAADITYTTAKEATADFLRDRLALGEMQNLERRQIRALFDQLGRGAGPGGVVMRGIHAALVDEADSLLIDEAVTPLIISRQVANESFVEACRAATRVAARLQAGTHYTLDREHKDVELAPGFDGAREFAGVGVPRRYTGEGFLDEMVRQALVAREFFHLDKQYVIQEGKVVIVDDFTGRTMAQRTWSAGLHQMVEAKEQVEITPPNETLARISFQRFFRFYHSLAGMTGTASESADELWHVYGLSVVRIPRNRPSRRSQLPLRLFETQEAKLEAIADEIEALHAQGRPVLAGTRSVRTSEALAAVLRRRGLACRVINAVRHKEEAAIIAEAGKRGAVTVATNMAGRGTDILLDKEVEALGGLHVIGAECNESGRVDRQLYGRSGRQGDRGSARAYVSMDDDLFERFFPGPLRTLLRAGSRRWASPRLGAAAMRLAQSFAQRRAYSSRQAVQKFDTWVRDSLLFGAGEF